MTETSTSFYLGDWYVDTITNELKQGDKTVKIETKVMDVLFYLVQHSDQLITREQLEQAIWGNTVVGYDALTGCIAKLRKTLGDSTRKPSYIETIPKRGYRLIATVDYADGNQVHKQGKQHNPIKTRKITYLSIVIVLSCLLTYILFFDSDSSQLEVTSTSPSIVVLPFNNLSDGSEHNYFSNGMTADITTALSKLSGLLVISPSSAQSYESSKGNHQEISKSLGVRYILEGNVRRENKKLRININLIDARSNSYLWSEKFDRNLINLFDIQDEITDQIISTLKIKFTEEEKNRTAHRYTNNIKAYDDFLRGQALYSHYSKEDNLLARDLYQQAILRDENFARAYSSIALTYIAEHRYGWNKQSTVLLDQALKYASRGSALDAELPQAYWVLAYAHLFRKEYDKATIAANTSIQIEPNYADSYISLAICKIHFNLADEALLLIKKAMLLNPKHPAAYSSVLGQIYFYRKEYELAEVALNHAIEKNSSLLTPHIFLTVVLHKLGRNEDAVWSSEQIKIMSSSFNLENIQKILPIHNPAAVNDIKNIFKTLGFDKK